MDVLLIILLALLVVIAITAALVLRARPRGRKVVQQRVEARARMSKAGEHAAVAEREEEAAQATRDQAERERLQAEAHLRKAEAAEHAADERFRTAEAEREAADHNRERALAINPDGDERALHEQPRDAHDDVEAELGGAAAAGRRDPRDEVPLDRDGAVGHDGTAARTAHDPTEAPRREP